MGKVGNLYGCLNPVRIYNMQLKQHVYVPCRKCAFCTSVRHIDLKCRVEREHDRVSKNRGCAWFITLTYDNNHVPYYFSERVGANWYSNRQDYSLEDILHPIIKDTDVDKYPPIVGFPDDKRAFAHIHIPDVQLYIKKVRSHIDYYCKIENKDKSDYEFRYFVCAEYGPISFRPHYHVIAWFEGSKDGKSVLLEKLASLWSLGSCDIKAVTYGSVGNYVASYVTSSVNCMSVLQRKSIRARCTFSKSPSLGAVQVGREEIWKVLSTGAFDRVKWDDTDKRFVNDVPSLAVFRRYFPKCQGFGIKNHSAKLRVYRYVYDYCKRHKIVHNVDNIDELRLRDIDFKSPPRYAVNRLTGEVLNELTPNEVKDKSWKYTDKYASLICYKYCVLYSLTPEQVLEMFEKIYQNCSYV